MRVFLTDFFYKIKAMTKLLYNLLFPFSINSRLPDKVRSCWRCYLLPILLDPKQHFSRRIFTCYVYHSIPFPPTHIQGIQLWRPFTLFTAWKAWMVCRLSSHLDGDMEESYGGGGRPRNFFNSMSTQFFFLSSNLFYKCWNCIYYVIFGPFKRDSVMKTGLHFSYRF